MKTLITLGLTIVIMGVIFWSIDLAEFRRQLASLDRALFAAGVLFVVPETLLSAYRWQVMVHKRSSIGLTECVRLVLVSNALNALIPSRMGDLAKGYFMGKRGAAPLSWAMNVAIFEKYIDLAGLAVVLLTGIVAAREWNHPAWIGLAFSAVMIGLFPLLWWVRPGEWGSSSRFNQNRWLAKIKSFFAASQVFLNDLKEDWGRLGWIMFLSILLWFIHIFQFYVFFLALGSQVPLIQVFRLVPLAILVGLLPFTMAGIGTRDSALLYFFAPYETLPLIAGAGVLSSLRYLVPALLGLPFLGRYLAHQDSR